MSYYDRDRDTAAQTMNIPKAHHGNTAEFMVSGWPYLQTFTADGSTSFGYVTQWICVSAVGTDVTLTLDDGSAAFTVPAGTISPRFDFKCTKVTLDLDSTGAGKYACVSAGLTNVREADFPDITGYTGVA